MDLTATYIFSQIFFMINYIFLMSTYQVKKRKAIVILNLCSCLSMIVAYLLLKAYAGLAMVFVAITRNFIFLIDEKISGKKEITTKKDYIIMAGLLTVCALCAIPTFDGIWSLAAIFATMAYTISVCQKNIKVYRWMGLLSGSLWIIYNVYIKSVVGIICEAILLIAVVIGLVRIYKSEK